MKKTLLQEDWRELLSKTPNAVILDVRTENECANGIIENAICLDFFQKEKVLQAVEKMDKDKDYFVYCRSGNRSGMMCELLNSKGFKNTYNLKGGTMEWNSKLV